MTIAGSKVERDLDDLYVVMRLDEFARVGRQCREREKAEEARAARVGKPATV